MKEKFLSRWSRLKLDQPSPPAPTPPAAGTGTAPASPVAPPLPALDSLEFSSDFTAFMQEEVADGLRRSALQKLFRAEHFNVMDGLDVYVDDYNSFEPIGAEMLNKLNQARGLLFDDAPPAAATTPATAAAAEVSSGAELDSTEPPATANVATDKTE